MAEELDLGHNHWLRYISWRPDDLPANRAQYGYPLPAVDRAGAIIRHQLPNGEDCEAVIHFDLPELLPIKPEQAWQVIAWEPLTVSPSLLCACGDHGFIRDGRWVPA